MTVAIDLHTHVVPERFPSYAGKGANVPWPSMADAHACHKHVMIQGKVYRTVSDGSWSVPRRIEAMNEMRVARQVISPMPELLSYWLPLDDAQVLIRYLNDEIAAMVDRAPDRLIGLGAVPLQDVDAAIRCAEQAGATVKMPAADMFWGDRYGVVTDPYGHSWSLATHLRDLTPQQMSEGMQAAFAGH